MEEKNNKVVIGIVCGIIVTLLIFILLFATKVISFNFNSKPNIDYIDENDSKSRSNSNSSEMSEKQYLENIILNQLSILKGKNNIENITNQQKLSLALSILASKKGKTDIGEFTSQELADAFSESCISHLRMKHESIKGINSEVQDGNLGFGYEYQNGNYINGYRIDSGLLSTYILASKMVDYKVNGNKYVISMKYLFSPLNDQIDFIGLGKYKDAIDFSNVNQSKVLLRLSDEQNYSSFKDKEEAFQKLFEDKYNDIKDGMETYTYTFEKQDGKYILVDFLRG